MRRKWLLTGIVIILLASLLIIAPVSAAPTESGCSIVHVVQPGDTLYSIARRYGVNVWKIANANGIINPNYIYVGQRLVIPVCRPSGIVHVVKAGETLMQIALHYGVSVWSIAEANGLSNINYIYAGQRLFIPGSAPPPAPATSVPPKATVQPGALPGPWQGEYFDNVELTGTPYTTREDGSINFNWGWGPPAGGMPSNYFSIRWTGTFSFEEGTYRFYARVDDGVRLYVDDLQLIGGWRDGGLRTYTAEQTLAGGDHTVKVEYYDSIQVAKVYVWWEKIAGPTTTPEASTTATAAPSAGWQAEFFNNEELMGDPVVTRVDPWIGFEWGTGSPAEGIWSEGFSARWTRTLPLQTDHYRFCANADDGARIWVNGDLVLDKWGPGGPVDNCGTYWATTGNYEVVVEYHEHGGEATIYMWWEPH